MVQRQLLNLWVEGSVGCRRRKLVAVLFDVVLLESFWCASLIM